MVFEGLGCLTGLWELALPLPAWGPGLLGASHASSDSEWCHLLPLGRRGVLGRLGLWLTAARCLPGWQGCDVPPGTWIVSWGPGPVLDRV